MKPAQYLPTVLMIIDVALVPFKDSQDLATARDFENAKIIWEFVK